ncbi:MAG: DUF3465 domain-containing protein [Campylobacterota bacterium]|nr:DUF3465 domain-containing protein [Campylobacterota bacterium]
MHKKNINKIVSLFIIVGIGLFSFFLNTPSDLTAQETPHLRENSDKIEKAFYKKQSDIQVLGVGVVVKILKDDLKGHKHQRFILRLKSGHTILVAHNIDLAPKIHSLKKGDSVEFYGEYEYNKKGGVVHWTHHDPRKRHINGWLKHQHATYQ